MRRVSESTHVRSDSHVNLGEYARVVWRRKHWLLLPALAAFAIALGGVRFLVPVYESGAVIRVQDRAELGREVARFMQADRRGTRDAEVKARLKADLTGSTFLDALVKDLGLDRDPAAIAAAQRQAARFPSMNAHQLVMRRLRHVMAGRISVTRVGPAMFRVAYADADPDACFAIADATIKLYIDLQKRATIEGLQEVSNFSSEQLAVYKERLSRSERALEMYQKNMARRAARANPVSAANMGTATSLLRDLDVTINNTKSTISRIRVRLVEILGSLPNGEALLNDHEVKRMENTLAARRENEIARELGTGGNGDGVAASQQSLQRRLSDVVRAKFPDMNSDYRPLVAEYFYQQVELSTLEQKRGTLDSYIRAFREQVTLAPEMNAELERLRQDVSKNRTLYDTFQKSRTSTQISEAVQSTALGEKITVVENAARPLAPVRPHRTKIILLALVLGMSVGAGALILTEYSDSSFRTVDDLEGEFDLRVVGTIPRIDERPRWRPAGASRRAVVWSIALIVLVSAAVTGFYMYGKSTRRSMVEVHPRGRAAHAGGMR